MNTDDDKWNINRSPTKWDHIYGSIFSIIIFIKITLLLYGFTLGIFEKDATENAWISFLVTVILFIGSGVLMFRVVFGRRRKPSIKAIKITGYIIAAMSVLLITLAIMGKGPALYLASLGFTGLAGSSVIIKRSS